MNRIDQKFIDLKSQNKKAFIPFITAGDPNLDVTKKLVLAFEKNGADIVELGVPFSDPLADGPTIQAASQRSLQNGTTLHNVLDLVKEIRQSSDIPIALMLYYNPIFCFGEKKFIEKAKAVGVDGVIIPDLPAEEGTSLIKEARMSDIATVFFLSPTTSHERTKSNIQVSRGFIYFVSIAGVTGARQEIPKSIFSKIKEAKKLTDKPICVGFGVSTPDQVKSVAKVADGVIVGSAIVKEIEKYSGKKNLVSQVSRFVKNLAEVLD